MESVRDGEDLRSGVEQYPGSEGSRCCGVQLVIEGLVEAVA